MKPVSPRSKSGCHFHVPVRGSGGASNQPLGVRSDAVVAAVAVHVVGVNETGVAEVEIGMPLPRAGARVGRGFEPTLGSDDVVAAIAVHVTHADAMSPTLGADDVLDELAVLRFIPR